MPSEDIASAWSLELNQIVNNFCVFDNITLLRVKLHRFWLHARTLVEPHLRDNPHSVLKPDVITEIGTRLGIGLTKRQLSSVIGFAVTALSEQSSTETSRRSSFHEQNWQCQKNAHEQLQKDGNLFINTNAVHQSSTNHSFASSTASLNRQVWLLEDTLLSAYTSLILLNSVWVVKFFFFFLGWGDAGG